MEIGIDFDGTCVTHSYPEIGRDIGAIPILRKLIDKGHKLVLNTMRSGEQLQEAVDWFKQNELPLYGVNENPTQKSWTSSPKVYAQLYIDDASLGTPLVFPWQSRAYVDWVEVEKLLESRGLL